MNINSLSELEILKILKDPTSSPDLYEAAGEYIFKKYEKMIHYHWHMLVKQLNNSVLVNNIKDEYYSEAREALFTAIQKVDVSKIYDENFKLMQMASWYIGNVRNKMCRIVVQQASCKSTTSIADLEEDGGLALDPDVEMSWWSRNSEYYDPAVICVNTLREEECQIALQKCIDHWDDNHKKVFRYLQEKKSKNEIAEELEISPMRVYGIIRDCKADVKKALEITA